MQQAVRVVAGIGMMAVAAVTLTGGIAWLVGVSGAMLAGSGLVGYRPMRGCRHRNERSSVTA